jgi:hypothetical protein
MPSIDVAMQAHIDLNQALKKHGFSKTSYRNDPGVIIQRGTGPFADASLLTSIIEIIVPFTDPKVVLAFLSSSLPIILKWIGARAGKSVTFETEVDGRKYSISVKGHADAEKAAKALKGLIDHVEQRNERPKD